MAKRKKIRQSPFKKTLLIAFIVLAIVTLFLLSFIAIKTQKTISSDAAISTNTKYVPGQLLFTVKSGTSPSVSTIRTLTGYSDARIKKLHKTIYLLKSNKLKTQYNSLSSSIRSAATATSPDFYTKSAITKLQANSNYPIVKADPIVPYDSVPNDEYYFAQKPYLDTLGVEAAWDKTSGGQEVVIGLLDSGITLSSSAPHADLTNRMWVNQAESQGSVGVDDDGNGFKDDIYGYHQDGTDSRDYIGHGTHVAGIIAAEFNNGKDIAGLCPKCRIMSLKSADANNQGTVSNIIAGISYAMQQKNKGVNIKAINHSYGIQASVIDAETLNLLRQIFVESKNAGIISVASAGNRHEVVAQYPALFTGEDLVFTVAATNRTDALAFFSNYGTQDSQVDFAAPGTDQIVEGIISLSNVAGSVRQEGTSMAAPHVTGLIGLMLTLKKDLSYSQTKSILSATADNVDAVQQAAYKGMLGFGRINADRAITKLISDFGISTGPTATPTPIYPITSGIWSYTLTCSNGSFSYTQSTNGKYIGSYCFDITVNGSPSHSGCGWGGTSSGSGITGLFYREGSDYTMRGKIWDITRTTLLVDESVTRRCGS